MLSRFTISTSVWIFYLSFEFAEWFECITLCLLRSYTVQHIYKDKPIQTNKSSIVIQNWSSGALVLSRTLLSLELDKPVSNPQACKTLPACRCDHVRLYQCLYVTMWLWSMPDYALARNIYSWKYLVTCQSNMHSNTSLKCHKDNTDSKNKEL